LESFVCGGESCSYDSESEAIKIRHNRGGASAAVQKEAMDLSKADEMKVAFRYFPVGMATDDTLFVELWDGADWARVLELKRGAEFGQGDFGDQSTDYGYVRLGPGDVNFAPDAKIRIRCETETDEGAIYLKDIGIYVRDSVK
jgi:hypothetical protein